MVRNKIRGNFRSWKKTKDLLTWEKLKEFKRCDNLIEADNKIGEVINWTFDKKGKGILISEDVKNKKFTFYTHCECNECVGNKLYKLL